ncbi:hypothetical protein [Iodobacter ciconiae]|uniref:Uncharacterized protein n=1 Tax=Iodobacter ciconiae TaxID=2496266 RepID=A0A3S8ZP35_9NEIS|nr:hypothetical protein [Iodobacter ciconiae]AZN35169.1 hypothetical protein EJO50_00905 [Iodobacter ciconiae]
MQPKEDTLLHKAAKAIAPYHQHLNTSYPKVLKQIAVHPFGTIQIPLLRETINYFRKKKI